MVMKVLLTDVALDSLTSEPHCSFYPAKASLLEETSMEKLKNIKSFHHNAEL